MNSKMTTGLLVLVAIGLGAYGFAQRSSLSEEQGKSAAAVTARQKA